MSQAELPIYILKRLLIGVLVLFILSFGVFTLLYISPGTVIDSLLGTAPRTPSMVAFLTHKYHLDKPFLTQYWYWLRGALHLNFGNSIIAEGPVSHEIWVRLPTSLYLGLYAYCLVIIFGIIPGLIAALKNSKNFGRAIVAGSLVALCSPAFVTGVFLIFIFAVEWKIFPVAGAGSGFVDGLHHLTLPAFALAAPSAAFLLRHTRAAVLGVLNQDYVTFAKARGLSARRIWLTYAVRNALIPIVTASGLLFAGLIIGAVLVETTFSLPGIGNLLVNSANTKDLPMLQGLCLVVATIVILANLLADVAYALIDPRIRLGRRG